MNEGGTVHVQRAVARLVCTKKPLTDRGNRTRMACKGGASLNR